MLYPAELRGLRVGQEELTRVTDRPAILIAADDPSSCTGREKKRIVALARRNPTHACGGTGQVQINRKHNLL